MATSKVDFQIGPRNPTRYASFTNSSPTWGSAVARMGNAWAKSHAKRKTAEAERQFQTEQARKRGAWATAIGQGATVRDIAQRDSSIIDDSSFLKFLSDTKTPKGFEDVLDDQGRPIAQRGPQGRTFAHPLAPEPEGPAAEMFEDVLDPYGFGGAGQRSSTTGKIIGYQGAPSQPKGSERRTAKDQTGRLRYLDTGEPAFADSLFDQTPEVDEPEPAKFEHVRALAGDWESATKPVRDLSRQRDLMQIGLDKARAGDMAAGSQAVLVTFQKILDPASVVRESEYARSSSGLSMFERIKGGAEKLGKGGAGVSVGELEAFARLADEAVTKFGGGWLDQERERIGRFADAYNIPRDYVFQGGGPAPQAAPEPPQGLTQAAAPALPQAAPQPQAPAGQTPGFAALANALAGPQRPQAAPPPRGPAPAAASMTGSAPAYSLPAQRIADYAILKPDELRRQVAKMNANRGDYSPEELHAAAMAWQRKFGE